MNVLFTPFGILGGILAGLISASRIVPRLV